MRALFYLLCPGLSREDSMDLTAALLLSPSHTRLAQTAVSDTTGGNRLRDETQPIPTKRMDTKSTPQALLVHSSVTLTLSKQYSLWMANRTVIGIKALKIKGRKGYNNFYK